MKHGLLFLYAVVTMPLVFVLLAVAILLNVLGRSLIGLSTFFCDQVDNVMLPLTPDMDA